MHLHFDSIWAELTSLAFATAAIVGSYLAARNGFTKRIIALKNELIADQGKKIKELQDKDAEQQNMINGQQETIGGLRRELDVWKKVPLKQLSDDYHALVDLMKKQTDIWQRVIQPPKKKVTTIEEQPI